jgi:hypothetical protein
LKTRELSNYYFLFLEWWRGMGLRSRDVRGWRKKEKRSHTLDGTEGN